MKIMILPFLMVLPVFLIAQDDDYCPCQEELQHQAEFFDFVNAVNVQMALVIPQQQETTPQYIPETVQEPIIEIQLQEEVIPEQEPEIVEEELLEEIVKEERFIDRSNFKKVRKRKKMRLKRKKKFKKYRGKCPFF